MNEVVRAQNNMQQTSLDAWQGLTNKQLGERQAQVLQALRELKEATNTMLASYLHLPINTITPRMLELRQAGYVIESYRDFCPITRRRCIFWKVAR